jgi:hypothetical protein
MKMNQYIIKLVSPSSSASLLTDHCSGAFLNEITRAVLLIVVLGLMVVLATGCAATSDRVTARLINPAPKNHQVADLEESDGYQPAGSPAFSDFFGS